MGGKIQDFLDVVSYIYKDDPAFVRPLDQDLKDRLHPKKNPFFEHAEGVIFTAHKNDRCVGRVTAQIDRDHLAQHQDATGFFGFFDTTEDQEVATALLAAAEGWLRSKGMKRIRGPVSLGINEELGCLVEGFDTPPFILMPHHLPYQGGLIQGAGYDKEKDFYAWRYHVGEMNARTKKAHAEIAQLPEVSARQVSMRALDRDVDLIVDIFNDAWSDNWGFVPITKGEGRKLAQGLRLIADPEITRIVHIDGEPAAVAIALPNVNELITDLRGKLLPFGILKLLYRLKVVGAKSGRLFILGIRKQYRHVRKYAGLSAYLYAEMNEAGKRRGMSLGELGWTVEDNGPMNVAIRALGAERYKRYRVFTKALEA